MKLIFKQQFKNGLIATMIFFLILVIICYFTMGG